MAWAPTSIGKTALASPWKCCKVFCALAVTVKRSVDQLLMHYFHNFSSALIFLLGGRDLERHSGSFRLALACVLRATTKKGRQLFEEKSAPQEKNPAHLWKKSCGHLWSMATNNEYVYSHSNADNTQHS